MARGQNFYYQDPTAAIGDSLVQAIFGNPEAAARQRQQQAEMEERAARTGLLTSQTGAVDRQNTASDGMPALLAAMRPQPMQTAPDGSQVATLPGAADRAFRDGLPGLIAAMAQMQGDKVDTSKSIGTLASFLGGDEMARRGLIAQGHTPGKDFAITPERADALAAAGYNAEQAKALGVAGVNRKSAFDVATINNASDIPVAQIGAKARVDAAGVSAGASRDVAGIKAGGGTSRGERNNNPGNIEMGGFATKYGATGSDGRFAIFPSYEAGVRAQEALLSGPGYVGGGRNTIDAIINRYAPPSDGNPVGNYADYVSRVTGIPRNQPIGPAQVPAVAEAMRQFETGNQTPRGKPGKATAAKPPKPISKAHLDIIDKEIKAYFDNAGVKVDLAATNQLRQRAINEFRRTGDPVGAVANTMNVAAARGKARKSQPAAGARTESRLTATNAKGERIVFDGRAWVPLK